MLELQRLLRTETDGGLGTYSDNKDTFYSNRGLFNDERGSDPNTYLPPLDGQTDDVSFNNSQKSKALRYKDYLVAAKPYFFVRLLEVGSIPFSTFKQVLARERKEEGHVEFVEQALSILLRSDCFAKLRYFGPSPHRFYFPETTQDEIFGNMSARGPSGKIKQLYSDSRQTTVPNVGMKQKVAFCDGGTFVNSDICVDYMDREFYPQNGSRRPQDNEKNDRPRVMLLECWGENNKGSLCGVPIDDLRQTINNQTTKQAILEKLQKLKFHARYERKSDSEWGERK